VIACFLIHARACSALNYVMLAASFTLY
jgi:hypothetical protein